MSALCWPITSTKDCTERGWQCRQWRRRICFSTAARKSINFSSVFCVLWRRRPWPRIIRRPAERAPMIDADRCGSAKKRGKGKGRKEGKKRRKEAEVNERKTQIRTDSGAVRSEDELHGELKANAVDGGYKAAYIPLIRPNSSPPKSQSKQRQHMRPSIARPPSPPTNGDLLQSPLKRFLLGCVNSPPTRTRNIAT